MSNPEWDSYAPRRGRRMFEVSEYQLDLLISALGDYVSGRQGVESPDTISDAIELQKELRQAGDAP